MKKHWKITGMILALALILTLSVAALAESPAAPAAEAPAVDVTAGSTATADTALQEALKALEAARSGDQLSDLEAELNAYVEAGKLTREQADLILKAYKDQEALRNGVCPNCGYTFSNGGFGRGGRMKDGGMTNGMGSRGGNGGFGGQNGRGGFGRQQNGMQPNGTQPNAAPAAPDAGES